jgi:hypothetical protein
MITSNEEFLESLEVHLGDRVFIIDAPPCLNAEGERQYACRLWENEYVFNQDSITYHTTAAEAIEAGWLEIKKLKTNGQ